MIQIKNMMLANQRYTGQPMATHFDIENISSQALEQQLKLFIDDIDKVYVPDRGQYFKTKKSRHC